MDGKKDLNPELKAIYDRVMNTQVKPPTPASRPTATPTPSTPPPPPAHVATPSPSVPPQPQHSIPSVSINTIGTVTPKPLSTTGSQPYVFTSGKKASSGVSPKAGFKIPKIAMAIGGLLLIVVYTVIWLKIFKYF